jgi:hypothetical protein
VPGGGHTGPGWLVVYTDSTQPFWQQWHGLALALDL